MLTDRLQDLNNQDLEHKKNVLKILHSFDAFQFQDCKEIESKKAGRQCIITGQFSVVWVNGHFHNVLNKDKCLRLVVLCHLSSDKADVTI